MKKQNNQSRLSLIMIIFATIFIFSVTSSASAQKSLNDKYPKPDFSAMADYWEVVSYEYDFTTGGVPTFTIVAKRKQDKAPMFWLIDWRDANGVLIVEYNFLLDGFHQTKVGEPTQATSHAPFKADMPRVKSVKIIEDPKN